MIDDEESEMERIKAAIAAMSPSEKAFYDERDKFYAAQAEAFFANTIPWHRARLEREAVDSWGKMICITPTVEVYREGRQVAEIVCLSVDRDDALWAAQIAVGGLRADRVILATDSRYTTSMINPLTGNPWERDEMQQLVLKHPEMAREIIFDCLTFITIGREGNEYWASFPYQIHDNKVDWAPAKAGVINYNGSGPDTPLHAMKGLIPEALRAFFELAPVTSLMNDAGISREDFGLSEEEAEVHMDCAVTRVLLEAGRFAVLLLPDTDRKVEIIQKSLGEHVVSERRMKAKEN